MGKLFFDNDRAPSFPKYQRTATQIARELFLIVLLSLLEVLLRRQFTVNDTECVSVMLVISLFSSVHLGC
jgi:hypothetical protein